MIDGIPADWKPVKFDVPSYAEFYLDNSGLVRQCCEAPYRFDNQKFLIIERIPARCTWNHGTFNDGWLAEDKEGYITWFPLEPYVSGKQWVSGDNTDSLVFWVKNLRNPPVFDPKLPWTDRIQLVGPTIEAQYKKP